MRQRRVAEAPPARRRTVRLIDPATGVWSVAALTRDVLLERAWPAAPPFTLAAVELRTTEPPRNAAAGDAILLAFVEVVPMTLQARDRVYRSGPAQFTLFLRDADIDAARAARAALEASVNRLLSLRGLPTVRLGMRIVDPVALSSHDSSGPPASRPATSTIAGSRPRVSSTTATA